MLKHGMVEEIRDALAAGISTNGNALRSVGVQEVIAYLKSQADLPWCHELLSRKTRQYAKKQLSWGRAIEGAVLLDAKQDKDILLSIMLKKIAEVSSQLENGDSE